MKQSGLRLEGMSWGTARLVNNGRQSPEYAGLSILRESGPGRGGKNGDSRAPQGGREGSWGAGSIN